MSNTFDDICEQYLNYRQIANTFSEITTMTNDKNIKSKAEKSLKVIDGMNKNIKKRMLELANSNGDVDEFIQEKYDDDDDDDALDYGEEIEQPPAKKYAKKQNERNYNVGQLPRCKDCGKTHHRSGSWLCLNRKLSTSEQRFKAFYACHDDEGKYPCVRTNKDSAIQWIRSPRRKKAKNMEIRKFLSREAAIKFACDGI